MAYGIEVYKETGVPTLLSTMLGGRVFYGVIEVPTTGTTGTQTDYVLQDIPGSQYLKYYIVEGGSHSISTYTNASGKAVIRATEYTSLSGFRRNSIIALFPTQVDETGYGILTVNSTEEKLVSAKYVTPVFKGKITFNATPTYSYGLSREHHAQVTQGDSGSTRIILYTIPESSDVWFAGDPYVTGTNPQTIITYYRLASSTTTYSLAEAFVFQINSLTASNHTYGIRIYNNSSQITFDGGLQHVDIKGYKSNINFYEGSVSTYTDATIFNNYSAILLPQYWQERWVGKSGSQSSNVTQWRGMFRRSGSTLYSQLISQFTYVEDAFSNGFFDFGNQYDSTLFAVDTNLLGGTGSGGSGNTGLSATITEGSGSDLCSYSTDFGSQCTTTRVYSLSLTGSTDGTETYAWSFTTNPGGLVFDTGTTGSSVTVSKTGSSGTYNATLKCTINKGSTTIEAEYIIVRTHSTATATYTLTENVTSVNEGSSVTFTLSTTAIPTGTTLYWTTLVTSGTVNALDFTDNIVSNSFTHNNNYSTIQRNLRSDETTETTAEKFKLEIRTGSTSGTVKATSSEITIVDTSQNRQWILSGNNSVQEGNTLGLTINSYDYYSSNPPFTISDSAGLFTFTPSSGVLLPTEPNVYTDWYRLVNAVAAQVSADTNTTITVYESGQVRATKVVTVTNYVAPSYSLTTNYSSRNEGESFIISFSTNQAGSFAYTISGVSSADIGGASLTGNISNGGTLSYTITADQTTEGTETFTIALNNGLASVNVTINDSSQTPVPPPTANFFASPTSGYAPLGVQFYDQSTGSPTSWAWDLDTSSPSTDSTSQNPYNVYSAGTYSVKLTVSNAGGSNSYTRTNYIVVTALPPAPTASFTASPSSGTVPLTVSFTDTSSGSPTSWSWDFKNDGTATSSSQNPSYTYQSAGTYTAKLTVSNIGGSTTTTRTITVNAPVIPAVVTSVQWDKAQVATNGSGTFSFTFDKSTYYNYEIYNPSGSLIYYSYGAGPALSGSSGTRTLNTAGTWRGWVAPVNPAGNSVYADISVITPAVQSITVVNSSGTQITPVYPNNFYLRFELNIAPLVSVDCDANVTIVYSGVGTYNNLFNDIIIIPAGSKYVDRLCTSSEGWSTTGTNTVVFTSSTVGGSASVTFNYVVSGGGGGGGGGGGIQN